MKWCIGVLCATAVLTFSVAAALAADAPPEAKKPAEAKKADDGKKPALEGELAIMAKECQLSEEQQGKLAATAAEAKSAVEGWEKKNAEKLDAFRKARSAAIEAKDEAALKKALDDIRPLAEENRALQTKYQAAIMAILTPEQKVSLQGFVLSMEMGARLKGFNLTEAQSAKLRTMCNQAAKDLADVKGEGEEAMTAQRGILDKLTLGIRDNVLTTDQKAKLAPPPENVEPKPEAEKKPAAEKKPEVEKKPEGAAK